MIVLDLSNELFHGWEVHDQFYGKRWIYSVIHSFGGNTPWHGDLGFYATDAARTKAAASGAHLAGYGMAPEGVENNEVVYELMCDAAWSREPIETARWLVDYQRARYGAATPQTIGAWESLRREVYSSTIFLCKHAFQGRPCAKPVADVSPSPGLLAALGQLLSAPGALLGAPLLRNDLVDIAARHAGLAVDARLRSALAALESGDRANTLRLAADADGLMRALDALLNVREDLRLERWIASARAAGTDAAERDLFERTARMQVTVWGGPDLHDYASKLWSGLVRDFYAMRWARYFEMRLEGRGEPEIQAILAAAEEEWTRRTDLTAPEPVGDLIGCVHTLIARIGAAPAAVG
jgi:alpha-N-acetylglucosaminidase